MDQKWHDHLKNMYGVTLETTAKGVLVREIATKQLVRPYTFDDEDKAYDFVICNIPYVDGRPFDAKERWE